MAHHTRLAQGYAAALAALLLAGCGSTGAEGVAADTPTRAPSGSGSATAMPSARPAADGTPPVTAVDPDRLPLGPAPAMAWYDPVTRTIHDGSRQVRVAGPDNVIGFAKAGSDYLITRSGVWRSLLVRVSANGRSTSLGRFTSEQVIVSTDGETVSMPRGRNLRIVRVRDGKVLHTHPLDIQGRVLEVDADGAVIVGHRKTYRWDFDVPKLRVLAPATAETGTWSHRRLALWPTQGRRFPVVGLPIGSGDPWLLPVRELPRRFSPDGRHLLTGVVHATDPRGYDTYDKPLRIRDARTGRAIHDFAGSFGWYDRGAPRWESNRSFVALWRPRFHTPTTQRLVWVRCNVGGKCERISPTWVVRTESDIRHTAPWLLADQPGD